ncbi:unnamed protein product [Mesocestoides corti]|uniref:Uncharacterized protein n=2 Tax=Mesocestoides corti TaxID=53468 RepID=A0A0R3UJ39_MESCO|nr:unnamed protein product [Mesocestoides corti]
MVAHGVISASSARELLQVQGKGTNGIEKLLDLLGSECDTPQHYTQDAKLVLLTNALRSTGQHALASRLDCGRKIKPAPPTDAKLDSNEYGCGSGLKIVVLSFGGVLLEPIPCIIRPLRFDATFQLFCGGLRRNDTHYFELTEVSSCCWTGLVISAPSDLVVRFFVPVAVTNPPDFGGPETGTPCAVARSPFKARATDGVITAVCNLSKNGAVRQASSSASICRFRPDCGNSLLVLVAVDAALFSPGDSFFWSGRAGDKTRAPVSSGYARHNGCLLLAYYDGADAAGGPASPTLRRRGQLSLWVQVAAIRLSPVYYEQLVPPPSPPQRRKKRLVPLTNATLEDGVVVQNLMETSHGAYFWIDLRSSSVKPLSPEHVTSTPLCETSTLKSQESAVSRFLCFVCCVRKRHKQSAQQPPPPTGTIDGPRASVDYRLPSSVLPLSPPTQSIKEATPEPPKVSKEREQEERLRRMKLAILDAKSSDFYAGLANPLSDAVVKFLEQTLGVLVLGARVESRCPVDCLPQGLLQPLSAAATVSIVATTCEALERLHAAVTLLPQENSHLPPSSALSTALESIFRQEVGFLESIDIQDVRLSVGLQEEEVKLAANELAE